MSALRPAAARASSRVAVIGHRGFARQETRGKCVAVYAESAWAAAITRQIQSARGPSRRLGAHCGAADLLAGPVTPMEES